MGASTGIAWTDATWNCWQGCHKVSTGCKNCYMFTDKKRYGQNPDVVVRSADSTFNAPLKWARNREKYGHINRVFVDSWSDFFIEEADPWRAESWAIIRQTPNLTYQICTKRPERIAACLPADWGQGYPNVWLMVTAENQPMADLRIPILLSIPAVVHGVSVEPMVGAVDLSRWLEPDDGLDWVICGGESGPNARPMHPDWARSLRDQCKVTDTPFFFKQWGEWAPTGYCGGSVKPEDRGQLLPATVICSTGKDVGAQTFHAIPTDPDGDTWRVMNRVGKQAAGAILDGREWKEFPAVIA